ncbi:hypothetical protein ASZ90_018505 [hydrocarbon metagenome]|uniref:Transposase IS200-like domain-containing protein n=1 Tax=hydrocarbon metagenome TaxID=938273 RepID=A0A0W8E603_9ZZZZ
MGRVQREYSPTGCYHIMLRGNERKNIFLDESDRRRFLRTVLKKKSETELAIYAYCLMENHIHLVMREEQNEISNIMKGIATSYAMFFNTKYERIGHVFQDRFKSESVHDDRYLMSVIRYVHNNPVKAGIVVKAGQYEWSSYRSYLNMENSPLVDAVFVLEMISENLDKARLEFKRFSNEEDETEYLDNNDEMITTLGEGQMYLQDSIAKKWPQVSMDALLEDKKSRYEIIKDLRNNTGLSIRKIADLLGLHRRVVERIVSNK